MNNNNKQHCLEKGIMTDDDIFLWPFSPKKKSSKVKILPTFHSLSSSSIQTIKFNNNNMKNKMKVVPTNS